MTQSSQRFEEILAAVSRAEKSGKTDDEINDEVDRAKRSKRLARCARSVLGVLDDCQVLEKDFDTAEVIILLSGILGSAMRLAVNPGEELTLIGHVTSMLLSIMLFKEEGGDSK